MISVPAARGERMETPCRRNHSSCWARNRKKGEELAKLLAPAGLEIRTLADFPNAADVVEDGDTFAANAILKAGQQAKRLGCWVAADDSGLAVDALGGAPGVLSARYAGPQATDEANNRRLLEELAAVPIERRRRNSFVTSPCPTRRATSAPRARLSAAAASSSSLAGPTASATTRCSRSSSIIAPSAS